MVEEEQEEVVGLELPVKLVDVVVAVAIVKVVEEVDVEVVVAAAVVELVAVVVDATSCQKKVILSYQKYVTHIEYVLFYK